jgi:hypothetical protein
VNRNEAAAGAVVTPPATGVGSLAVNSHEAAAVASVTGVKSAGLFAVNRNDDAVGDTVTVPATAVGSFDVNRNEDAAGVTVWDEVVVLAVASFTVNRKDAAAGVMSS